MVWSSNGDSRLNNLFKKVMNSNTLVMNMLRSLVPFLLTAYKAADHTDPAFHL
jgi:hypothetical protein